MDDDDFVTHYVTNIDPDDDTRPSLPGCLIMVALAVAVAAMLFALGK